MLARLSADYQPALAFFGPGRWLRLDTLGGLCLSQRPQAHHVRADGVALPFRDGTFDAVFSTATFHWIKDHDRLFTGIHRVLKAGGRLVSQCGGGPNLQKLYRRARQQRMTPKYRTYYEGWGDPWHVASPGRRSGKRDVS